MTESTATEITLAEIMSRDLAIIEPDRSLADAARMMVQRRVGALVVDRGNGYGIISDRDMTRAAAAGHGVETEISERHTQDIIQATPDWSLERAAETMARGGFRHLLVVDEDGRAVGMISIRDIVRAQWPTGSTPEETDEPDAAAARRDLLYSYRRSAKQHLVAANCGCELDWLEVLTGQLEARPGLGEEEIKNLWSSRAACPRLMEETGGAD